MRRLFLFALLALPAAAETVTSADPPFTFQVPADWAPHPEKPAGVAWGWVKPLGSGTRLIVSVETLKDLVTRENLSALSTEDLKKRVADLPGGSLVSARQTAWQGRQINVIEIDQPVEGSRIIICRAVVPLPGRGILFSVAGRASNAAEARAELDRALAALQGTPTWRPQFYETSRFWLIMAACGCGYLSALVYFICYLAAFRWIPDFALGVRFWWQSANAIAIVLTTILSQVLSGWLEVAGKGSGASGSSGGSSMICPAIILLPILISWQKLKARMEVLRNPPPPAAVMPVFVPPGVPPPNMSPPDVPKPPV